MGHSFLVFLKGIAMGAANVIPGVSGGTIAFVTGIYEEFIDSLKSFDLKAVRLAARLQVRELVIHLNLAFLVPLFLGVAASLFSLGILFDWLFSAYPVYVWAFFFGLILASVYYVSRSIRQRSANVVAFFLLGTAAALALAFIKPASEDESFIYVALCGVVAVCSMILPGLSGSFVLILMGNYQLIMLQAVPNLDLAIILPFAIGGAVGFIVLSHVVSYFLRRFHDGTLSTLTGFILGSLVVIWPWKSEVYLRDTQGELLLKDGETIVQGYQWSLPELATPGTWLAFVLIGLGIVAVALLERTALKS